MKCQAVRIVLHLKLVNLALCLLVNQVGLSDITELRYALQDNIN